MSIPSTETKPDGIHQARRPQGRYVRQMIKTGSPREREAYAQKLIQRSRVDTGYFAQLALGLVLLLVGILLELPLLVLIAGVSSPVINPLVGLVSASLRPSYHHLLKSLLYLVFTFLLFFAVGWLVHLLSPELEGVLQSLSLYYGGDSWLTWIILVVFSVIGMLIFLFRDNIPPVIISTVLFFLIFIPITLAGYQMARVDSVSAASFLILAGARLFISLLVMVLTAWITGFQPQKVVGWLFLVLVIIAALLMINEAFGIFKPGERPKSIITPSPATVLVEETPAEVPTMAPTATLNILPTATSLPAVAATLAPTPTQTPHEETPTPALKQAEVISESGIVVRESPDTSSVILAYFNKGQIVTLLGEQVTQQGILWEKVSLGNDTFGWATSRYLQVIAN